jgi:cyclic pyranopterin phosphate synthase
LRADLVAIVARFRALPGVEEISLTTNGMLLGKLAGPLKQAGLDRVTVSLDSLRPERFRRITRTGDLATVLAGLEALERAGFRQTKINCVTMRGTNDDEFAQFARLTIERPLTVRFIEYMPLGDAAVMHAGVLAGVSGAGLAGPAAGCGGQERGAGVFVSEEQTRAAIEEAWGQLVPVERGQEAGVGPAEVYRIAGAGGKIGFISAMSAPFCATCNRLRLTAQGLLRSCLFEGGEVDLRAILRGAEPIGGDAASTLEVGKLRELLGRAMEECVRLKPQVHSQHGNQQMSRIGG